MDKQITISDKQRAMLRKYLDFMEGFSESNLYEDYRENMPDFTDEDYDKAMNILHAMADGQLPEMTTDAVLPESICEDGSIAIAEVEG